MDGSGLDKAYRILDLAEGATLDEVKKAYKFLHQNERIRQLSDWERAKEIDWAYEALCESLSAAMVRCRIPAVSNGNEVPADEESQDGFSLIEFLFPPVEQMESHVFWGRAFFLVVLVLMGLVFAFSPLEADAIGWSFMHLINLPFHEAGHIIFSFFGDFMRVLGGTLTQILIPLICMVAFVRKGDVFGASCGLWWMGQSFIDAAPYIYDARAGELMLLGGVTGQDAPEYHDWHNLLNRLGILSWDHGLAYGAKLFGIVLILLSILWAGWFLLRYCQNRTRS
jgi:hypothetical protein